MDAFAKIRPGQRLPGFPAALYNRLIDIVREADARPFRNGASGVRPLQNTVRVRNTSGQHLRASSIVGLDVPTILPSQNALAFQREVVMDAVIPTESHVGRWAVLVDDLANGAIGDAVAAGIAACRLTHDPDNPLPFAECVAGNHTSLTASAAGSARILWIDESGPWAVVRIGDGAAGGDCCLGVAGGLYLLTVGGTGEPKRSHAWPFLPGAEFSGGDYFGPEYTMPSGDIGDSVKDIAFSPDGRWVAIASFYAPYLTICPVVNGEFGEAIAAPAHPVESAAWSVSWHPSGGYLAVGTSGPPFLSVYRWASGELGDRLSNPASPPMMLVRTVAFDPAGGQLAVGGDQTNIVNLYPFNPTTGTFGTRYFHTMGPKAWGRIWNLCWHPAGGLLAVAGEPNPDPGYYTPSPAVLDCSSGTAVASVFEVDTGAVGVDWSPDGRFVAYTQDLRVKVAAWAYRTGTTIGFFPKQEFLLADGVKLKFSPDSQYLAIANHDASNSKVIRWLKDEPYNFYGTIAKGMFGPAIQLPEATLTLSQAWAVAWNYQRGSEGIKAVNVFVPVPLVVSTSASNNFATVAIGWNVAQGDLLYGFDDNVVSRLPKDDSGVLFLSNQGFDNAPKWSAVTVSGGSITGTVGLSNGGTGADLSSGIPPPGAYGFIGGGDAQPQASWFHFGAMFVIDAGVLKLTGSYYPDDESAAYAGIDNTQSGSPYARVDDLNALREAYENLRALVESFMA